MPVKWTVEIAGLNALRSLLKPPETLYAKPWADGMEDLARQSLGVAQSAAPARSGKLRASIKVAVQKRPFPQWLAVRVRARSRGYPYPRLLEFSPKHHHHGWLRAAVHPVWSGADRVLERIGKEIGQRWERE